MKEAGVSDQRKRLVSATAAGLKEIAEEFRSEVNRQPSSGELLEILALALNSLQADLLLDVNPTDVIALKPELKPGVLSSDSRSLLGRSNSAVSDLNDITFVIANDTLANLANALRGQSGHSPTLTILLESLLDGLRQTAILADINSTDIERLVPVTEKKKKTTAKVGDLIAIPAKNGQHFIALLLVKNRFGPAFGFFQGTHDLQPVSRESHPPVDPHPIYSEQNLIANGRWKIIGHDENLLSLFPADPEIYHYQHSDRPNPDIGPYGSGETASGKLRPLTQEEAGEVGLLSEEYRQFYLPESLEKYLNQKYA